MVINTGKQQQHPSLQDFHPESILPFPSKPGWAKLLVNTNLIIKTSAKQENGWQRGSEYVRCYDFFGPPNGLFSSKTLSLGPTSSGYIEACGAKPAQHEQVPH